MLKAAKGWCWQTLVHSLLWGVCYLVWMITFDLNKTNGASDLASKPLFQPFGIHFLSNLTSCRCPPFTPWRHLHVCCACNDMAANTPTPPTMVRAGYRAHWQKMHLQYARMIYFISLPKGCICCLATCFWNKLLQTDKISWQFSHVLLGSVRIIHTATWDSKNRNSSYIKVYWIHHWIKWC